MDPFETPVKDRKARRFAKPQIDMQIKDLSFADSNSSNDSNEIHVYIENPGLDKKRVGYRYPDPCCCRCDAP
jgi:hypothetical protein